MELVDVYVVVMYSLSSTGFFIIFVSLYLLRTVPTKLTRFTRFVIHGHDVSSALTQLYFTIGTVPVIILPCISGYPNGLLHYFDLMSTVNQVWTQCLMISVTSSFSILLAVNRTLAISVKNKNWRNFFLTVFIAQALAQFLLVGIAGLSLEDGGKEIRAQCIQMLPYQYPAVLDAKNGIHFSPSQTTGFKVLMLYVTLNSVVYLSLSSVCGAILIRSIRKQAKSSQSPQFLANQRRLTSGIIYFVILELVGLGFPAVCVAVSSNFGLGTQAISHYALISMSVYPIFGCYYVLMSNPDYRSRVFSFIKKARNMQARTKTVNTTLVSVPMNLCIRK